MNILNIKNLRERSLQKKNDKLLLAYPTAESRVEYLSKKFPTVYLKEDITDQIVELISIDSLFLSFAKNGLHDVQLIPSHFPSTEYEAYLELKFLSRKNRKRAEILGRRSNKIREIIFSEEAKSTELKSPIHKIAQMYSTSIYKVYCTSYSSTLAINHIISFIDALVLMDNILPEKTQEKILDVIKVDPEYLTIETLYNLTAHFRNESNYKDSNTEKTPDCWLLSLKGKRFVDLTSEA